MALFRTVRASYGLFSGSQLSLAIRGPAVAATLGNGHAQKRSQSSLSYVPVDDLIGGLSQDQIQVSEVCLGPSSVKASLTV